MIEVGDTVRHEDGSEGYVIAMADDYVQVVFGDSAPVWMSREDLCKPSRKGVERSDSRGGTKCKK